MVQSTVADSILGALGSIGGISGRRAQDGLVAAQAQGVSLENKVKQRLLDDDEESRQFGELSSGGFIKPSDDGRSFTVDAVKLANERPDLLASIMGPEANKFLTTKSADGKSQPLTFAGVQKLPGKLNGSTDANGNTIGTPPQPVPGTPVDTPLPAATMTPDRYAIMVKTADGRIVPATQNASADPNDPLIIMDAAALNAKVQARVNRMHAGGAAGNNATMQGIGVDFLDASRAALQQSLIADGGAGITEDPVGQRGLYDVLDTLEGEDLRNAVRDNGLDPDQIQAEAAAKWAENHKGVTEKIKVRSEDAGIYENNKSLLERQVSQADKAIADYDATPKGKTNKIDNAMNAMGAAESGRIGSPKKTPAPVNDPARAKLVAARDAAAKKLGELKPPTQKYILKDVPAPKFEWTDQNLRDSVAGKLEQPTAEQTKAIADYGREQGVTKAQDLANLPRDKAQALAWVIASNTRGTPTEKMGIFSKLSNYIQTADTEKSAIDANVAIEGVRVDQANAATNANQVQASIDNSIRTYNAAMFGHNVDIARLQFDTKKYGQSVLNDLDTAAGKVAPLLNNIYKGTLVEGNKFNPQGPTPEAMAAWKELDAATSGLPDGSPLKMAASSRYLEGFMTMAAAQASKPGAAAWWDWTKMFANTFLREDGMVDLSPLIEQATVKKWKNGLPEEITFAEGGARGGKPTSQTVGAAEFSRYLGTSGMKTFVDALYFQKAANVLGSGADPEAIAAKSMELKVADGYTKPT